MDPGDIFEMPESRDPNIPLTSSDIYASAAKARQVSMDTWANLYATVERH